MRPFIYNLALKYNLNGIVYNDDSGVKISICGSDENCKNFINEIKSSLPPLARIDKINILPNDEFFDNFEIVKSQSASKISPILPDFAICAQCESEFNDPLNPRFHHPFINCTHCGPRFSIIKSLPYDRANTTMSEFNMCEFCASEYENPTNRRFHTQPIACNNCGAEAFLKDLEGNILSHKENAFKECARLLENGKIIAIKGLGGFHLCCDATNESAIKSLRERKVRPHKPLAVMCKNLKMAQNIAELNKYEKSVLCSQLRPILLSKISPNFKKSLSQIIAPNMNKIGIFLAPTSLNLLLFHYFKRPIIATSANVSGEPIITNYNEICAKLSKICDFVLDHNREILNSSDDSVAFCANLAGQNSLSFLRTSRGIMPKITPFKATNNADKCILAIGAELKNHFAIYQNGMIFHSPYIGDLKNIATFKRFLSLLEMFKNTYKLCFDSVIADLHPHFLHSKHFEQNGFKIQKIQHHKAHIYSVMSENELPFDADVIGFAFDGTGYGEDTLIWGGEVFTNKKNGLERLYHFDDFALIGSQNSIKNIHFLAHAILRKYDIKAPWFYSCFDEKKIALMDAGLKASKVRTTSLGRVFDAVSSLGLKLDDISYDAQGAMSLESFYDKSLDIYYDFSLNDDIISFKEVFKNIVNEMDIAKIATGFINGIAKLIAYIAKKHDKSVVLSGGCFLNKALLEKTCELLSAQNTSFYLPKELGAGDSAIATGQIYWALNAPEQR